MNDKNRDPIDRDLWDTLGGDEAPDLGASVWPDVARRVRGTPSRRPLPRLVTGFAAAACLALGVLGGWLATPGSDGGDDWLTPDELVAGSAWDTESWTLDGLYAAASTDDDGGER